jgi:hypothetical protein
MSFARLYLIVIEFQWHTQVVQDCQETQIVPLPVCRLIARRILTDPA